MSQPTPAEIVKKSLVYRSPLMDAVNVRHDTPYAGALTMDVHYPPDWKRGTRAPAVIFVLGYSDVGFETLFGCKFKEMTFYVEWAKLVASTGMIAITYTNTDPVADLAALLQHVRGNAESLGIDNNRIGVWSSSGNTPVALSLLIEDAAFQCAALMYPYTLDLGGSTGVAEASRKWGFVNRCAGKSVQDVPREIPLFIARAGQDDSALNAALDRFVSQALSANLPITCTNHPAGPHAFDMWHDSETSREIIRQALGFLRFHLLG